MCGCRSYGCWGDAIEFGIKSSVVLGVGTVLLTATFDSLGARPNETLEDIDKKRSKTFNYIGRSVGHAVYYLTWPLGKFIVKDIPSFVERMWTQWRSRPVVTQCHCTLTTESHQGRTQDINVQTMMGKHHISTTSHRGRDECLPKAGCNAFSTFDINGKLLNQNIEEPVIVTKEQ